MTARSGPWAVYLSEDFPYKAHSVFASSETAAIVRLIFEIRSLTSAALIA